MKIYQPRGMTSESPYMCEPNARKNWKKRK